MTVRGLSAAGALPAGGGGDDDVGLSDQQLEPFRSPPTLVVMEPGREMDRPRGNGRSMGGSRL